MAHPYPRYSPETVRCDWGVPLSWARAYPEWPTSLRRWLRQVRDIGLTQIVVIPREHEVDLVAMRPGDRYEDIA